MAANDGRLVMSTIVISPLSESETVAERLIAPVVERAVGFVQNEQARMARDRPGDRNALQEADGQGLGCGLSEARVIAARKPIDVAFEVDYARRRARRLDLLGAGTT